jgi:UDP-N-acetylglucosamine 2-epimerase (non-hydrolysing)
MTERIFIIEPLDYPDFLQLLKKAYFVLTDSGGIQEEAPVLGKPVLVMRDVTERQEGVKAGVSRLVGTDEKSIVKEASRLLMCRKSYDSMARRRNPYGDGRTCQRIIRIMERIYKVHKPARG